MNREQKGIEPAYVWSLAFSGAVIAALGTVTYFSYNWYPHPLLPPVLRGLAGVYALLAVGLAGAMGEPLPKNPDEESVPLRLRVCWGILGLCPPPLRSARMLAGAAVCALTLYPASDMGPFSLLTAASVLIPAVILGKPKYIFAMGLTELWLMLGSGAAFIGALSMTSSHAAPEAWRGIGLLALLAVLHGQRARELTALRWAQLLPGVPPPPALDLSRYELSVASKAPEKRAALPEGVEAQLVDSGSFRVDAAKMLDKLRSYQLSEPADFLCAWLRCAAASGAKEMRLQTSLTGLELAFDGRAFTAAQLAQPYQALVDDEGTDGKRNRHFAYGLLGLYRLKPRSVRVTSRGPHGVAALSAGRGPAADVAAAPEGTVIGVEWPAWSFYWRSATLAARARERFGLGPAALTLDGRTVPHAPADGSWKLSTAEGWRIAMGTRRSGNRVRLYVLGTFIEELEEAAKAPVDAWLAHDELELDISQSAVVRGELLSAGLRELDRRWLTG